MTQLPLLRTRRFGAMFWTQFLGAFNDNLFKNALVILIAYRSMSVAGLDPQLLVVACGGIFIAPFLLFSATAGQLADRFCKPSFVRWVKAAEIGIMTVGVLGFLAQQLWVLLGVLFLMGAQSAFFGPVKYSILPELLEEDELVGGNALVETGTFLAILLGTIAGGVLVARGDAGLALLGASVLLVALVGYGASTLIPTLPPRSPTLTISWNPVEPIAQAWAATRHDRLVSLAVIGIAWFWFFGSAFLSLLPTYTKDVLGANEYVITLFLALFCTGIALGSLLCERLSGRHLELGLVPLGSIGMSAFALDLSLAGPSGAASAGPLAGVAAFLGGPGGLRIAADLLFLATFAGFFIVPLYTVLQQRARATSRSRAIAGNNILGALFMVASAVLVMVLLAAGLAPPQIFLVLALLNAAVMGAVYRAGPEFGQRFVVWVGALVRRGRDGA